MKLFALVGLLSLSAQGLAAPLEFRCTNKTNSGLMEEKSVFVTLTAKVVTATSKLHEFKGTFVKVAKSGSRQYSCPEVTDLADQTDYGYIFVTPSMLKGRDGAVTFSTRQLGDSEGAWWLNETFVCRIKN